MRKYHSQSLFFRWRSLKMPHSVDVIDDCGPPTSIEHELITLRVMNNELRSTVQVLSDDNKKLRARVEFLESSARLRAAALVPPSPSTRGEMACVSPAKVLLEQDLDKIPSPDITPSRKLDMVEAFESPTTSILPSIAADGSIPPCATSPFVIIKPSSSQQALESPFSLPIHFESQPPTDNFVLSKSPPRVLCESPYSLPITPSDTNQDEVQESLIAMMLPQDNEEGVPGCPKSPESPKRSSSGSLIPKDIGSLLAKVFGGAEITVVPEQDVIEDVNQTTEGGVLSTPDGDNWFPALPQPLLQEECWVSRGTYPSVSTSLVTVEGLPPPPDHITSLDPVLESKSLFKYIDPHNQFVGFYNACRDRMFTLTFVFKFMSKKGDRDIKLTILPGESKCVCHSSDFEAGYEVTVQYGTPTAMDVLSGVEFEEGNECDEEFPPRQISICRGWEGRSTQRRWIRIDNEIISRNFLSSSSPNSIRFTAFPDTCITSLMSILCEDVFSSFLKNIFSISTNHRHARLFSGLFATTISLDCYLPFTAYAPAFSSNLSIFTDYWPSFFHKAHAKLHGSYISGRKQTFDQLLRSVTGGNVEMYEVKEDVGEIIIRNHNKEGHQICLISNTNSSGLLKGAGYLVLQVKRIDDMTLIKIRNSWKDTRLWNGEWDRSSQRWIENQVADRIGMTFEEDGGVWMESREINGSFNQLCVCDVSSSLINNNSVSIKTQFVAGIPNLGIFITPSFSSSNTLSFRSMLQTESRSNSWEVSKSSVLIFSSPSRGPHSWNRIQLDGCSFVLESGFNYCVVPSAPFSFSGQLHLSLTSPRRNVANLKFLELSPSLIQSLYSCSPGFTFEDSPLVINSQISTEAQTTSPLLVSENVSSCSL